MVNILTPGLMRTLKFPPYKIFACGNQKLHYEAVIHKTADSYAILNNPSNGELVLNSRYVILD